VDNPLLWPLGLTAAYLGALALLSEIVERTPRLREWADHPLVYALALGVYATAWTLFGSVGFADQFGFGFLAISVGVALSCLAIPVLWEPLSTVVRRHGFSSVADLLSFRFQSQRVGTVVTCFLVFGLMPYISLQVRAILEAATFINGGTAPAWLGPAYACVMGGFVVGLGVRYVDPREHRPGLVATLAAESTFKLFALLAVGLAVLWSVFGGVSGLQEHLAVRPEAVERMYDGVTSGPWAALLVASFFAAFLLPRQFHVAYVEQPDQGAMRHVIWLLPLFLLLLNLPLPILYWAGRDVAPNVIPDLWVLATAPSSPLVLVGFLGAVSAATAMLLMSTIALSGMVMNHLVLPLRKTEEFEPERLIAFRRFVVGCLVFAGFALHWILPRAGSLVDLGLVSFVAVLQLAPGVLAVLWWRRANARGMLLGLAGGAGVWLVIVAVPLLNLGDTSLVPAYLGFDQADPRGASLWISIGVNALLFAVGSLFGTMRDEEAAAAQACLASGRPTRSGAAHSVSAVQRRLDDVLGASSAREEVDRALDELGMSRDEDRPMALRRLAERLERNLSELVGPMQARQALAEVNSRPTGPDLTSELAFLDSLRDEELPEGGLERSTERVRRFLSDVLEEMPIGVCTLDSNAEVIVWNQSMTDISGIEASAAVGGDLGNLPGPWSEFLADLVAKDPNKAGEAEEQFVDESWVVGRATHGDQRVTVTLQDRSAEQRLQMQVLHQDRLASVGRLAAGIAHEIGNPLSGLTMVAENLADEPNAEDAAERIDRILAEADRIRTTIQSMLSYARRDPQDREHRRFSLEESVREARGLVDLGKKPDKEIDFSVDVPDEIEVVGDPRAFSQLLVNLLDNAIDASPPGGTIEAFARWDQSRQEVDLVISDEGDGVSGDVDELFDPFYTTKPVGKGTGLGLNVAYWIADDHGARIDYERHDGRTWFLVRGLEGAGS